MTALFRSLPYLVVVALLASCATVPQKVFVPVTWPQNAKTPVVTMVAAGANSSDFGALPSWWDRVLGWITGETSGLAFGHPFDLAWLDDGVLAVVDEAGSLWKIDRNQGEFVFLVDLFLSDIVPGGIAAESGRIWVSDARNNRLVNFDDSGKYLGEITVPERPRGIDVREGVVAVALPDLHAVWIGWDARGQIYGKRGTAAVEFNYPMDVAFGAAGNLWIVDALNFRLQNFYWQENTATILGSYGVGSGQFVRPRGIASIKDTLFVSDMVDDSLQMFSPGQPLKIKADSGPGRLWSPTGISIRGNMLAVADSYNGRIVIYRIEE